MSSAEIMNSPWMWFACGLCVVMVLFQSIMFMRKSLRAGKKMGITDKQMKTTVKTALITGIGPSLGILVGMIALLVAMGGPISWFRLSYIGSVSYEVSAAELGAQAAGEALGANMSALAFATGVWTMTLGALGGILISGLFTDKMGKLQNLMAGGKAEMLPVISGRAVCGVFAYLSVDRVYRFDSQTVAVIAAFVIMTIFSLVNKKAQKKWINSWGFTISMFAGMLVSLLFV